MAESKVKISSVSMEAADNGVVISWCERKESKTKNTYDNCGYDYPKMVIEKEEGESNDDMIERAGKEFLKKWKEQYADRYEEED